MSNALTEKLARFLAGYAGKKLAIGASGGRDSMCLLHAVANCGVIDKGSIIAVHVNHGLRATADRDEGFVREYCKVNGISFVSYAVDVKGICAATGKTVEQAARELRYSVFADIIRSGRADYILTAHHAADNAESVLMHMLRGSGLDGACGMADETAARVLRPLLGVYPAELDGYAAANNIEYVTDETNFEDTADRNFLRLKVLPLIEERYPGAVRAINGFAAECGEVRDFLDGALDPAMIGFDRGAVTVKDEALCSPLASRYIRRAISHFSTVDVTREQIGRILALCGGRTGAEVLVGGMIAAREYGCVALYLPRERCDAECEVALGANFIDGLAIDIAESAADPRSVRGGIVDLDKLAGSVLRFRRDGDMFTPCGGKRKKLKQYFIDSKLPRRLRDRTPLLCRGDEVLVIVGVQISDEVKLTPATERAAAVRLRW